jgi:hypothetical protein
MIHQASQIYGGFIGIRANGEHSRLIGKNGYFKYLYEKHKWAYKDASEAAIDDSYIRLYLNLTGGDDDCPIGGYKNKKAVNLINKLKLDNVKFIDFDDVADKLGISEEDFGKLKERDACYNAQAHVSLMGEAEKLNIVNQLLDANRPSRNDFAYYNSNYFNNVVDETTLFMTL